MDYTQKYADFLKSYLKTNEKLCVVFDSSNGSTAKVLKKLFAGIDTIETHFINDKPDGDFPGHGPNPTIDNATDELIKKVLDVGADIGMIFDADGDRVVFIDNKGRKLDGVDAFLLLAQRFNPPFIVDVALGSAQMGWLIPNVKTIEVKTGTYFIKEAMRANDVEFGGESSSHYYFKDFFYVDSGIFAAVSAVAQVGAFKKDGMSLAKWYDALPKIHRTGEINLHIEDKDKAIDMVKKHFTKIGDRVYEIDGVSVDGDDYWLNVRASNTESLIRINIATKNKDLLEKIRKSVMQIVQQ